ncbi:MAG: TetR/AcrR family transcriptional regulator [Cyclobacteriaceae bacterium]|nr:TetR/AcrR family transcriptional regulator [Cyclobacteriaceae bacterium]
MSPRTKEQFEEIRKESKDKILKVAVVLFAEKGYASTSISQISKNAGISKGLIYNYFESKEDLLRQMILGLFEEMMPRFDLKDIKKLTREKFIELTDVSLDIVYENPHRWRLYTSIFTQPGIMDLFKEDLLKLTMPFIPLFIEYFKEKGHKNPEAMLRYYSATLDGIQLHILMDIENFPLQDVRELLINQFA